MKAKVIIFSLFLLVIVFGIAYGVKVLTPSNPHPQSNTPLQNSGAPVWPMPALEEKPQDTLVPMEKETVTPLVDRIAEWKTYRNKKYGYQVKYPKGWEIIEAKPRVGYKTEEAMNILYDGQVQKVTFLEKKYVNWRGEFQIGIISNPDKLSLEQYINKSDYADVSGGSLIRGISDTTVSGKPAKRLSIFAFDHEGIEIIMLYKGYIYYISFTDNPSDAEEERHQQIYQQILSTFRF